MHVFGVNMHDNMLNILLARVAGTVRDAACCGCLELLDRPVSWSLGVNDDWLSLVEPRLISSRLIAPDLAFA